MFSWSFLLIIRAACLKNSLIRVSVDFPASAFGNGELMQDRLALVDDIHGGGQGCALRQGKFPCFRDIGFAAAQLFEPHHPERMIDPCPIEHRADHHPPCPWLNHDRLISGENRRAVQYQRGIKPTASHPRQHRQQAIKPKA